MNVKQANIKLETLKEEKIKLMEDYIKNQDSQLKMAKRIIQIQESLISDLKKLQ